MEYFDIKLECFNEVTCEGGQVSGVYIVDTPNDLKHNGVELKIKGLVEFTVSPENESYLRSYVGIIPRATLQPIMLAKETINILPPGVISDGKTDISFVIPISPEPGMILYETYRGNYITISYEVECTLSYGYFSRDSTVSKNCNLLNKVTKDRKNISRKSCHFILQSVMVNKYVCPYLEQDESISETTKSIISANSSRRSKTPKKGVRFHEQLEIYFQAVALKSPLNTTEEVISKENALDLEYVPSNHEETSSEVQIQVDYLCLVTGTLESDVYYLNEPLTGQITVVRNSDAILSVDVELIAIETCGQDYIPAASVIHSLQVAEANANMGMPIPIYIIFPQLLTCPTIIRDDFRLEFAVKIVVNLQEGSVSKMIPIKLVR